MSKRILRRPAGQSTNTYWKLRAFKKLGGFVCQCCEEHRKVFLTIDHIKGGGIQHRKQFKGGHTAFYKWIAQSENVSDLLQVLCMNCNWGKRNGKPCPHLNDNKMERQREEAIVLREEIAGLEEERDRLQNKVQQLRSLLPQVQVAAETIPQGFIKVRHIAPLDWNEFEQPGDTPPSDNGAKVQNNVAQA